MHLKLQFEDLRYDPKVYRIFVGCYDFTKPEKLNPSLLTSSLISFLIIFPLIPFSSLIFYSSTPLASSKTKQDRNQLSAWASRDLHRLAQYTLNMHVKYSFRACWQVNQDHCFFGVLCHGLGYYMTGTLYVGNRL